MTDTFVTPRPDFKRQEDGPGKGRPLIVPPSGGRRTAYTRATTFVGAAEDMYNIHRWERRMDAIGFADRKDLLLAVAAHRDDKKRLDRICDEAKEAAKASAAATTGTAVHSLTEVIDEGRHLPELPDDVLTSLEAYRTEMARFTIVDVEAHLVQDYLKVAGTTDRIIELHGERYIADIKTGSTIELGIQKIAGQLAMYARSRPYDVTTDTRGDAHGASLHRGLIIWLPADTPGRCELVWVDLLAGWEWVKTCRDLRVKRGWKYKDLTEPFDPDVRPALSVRQDSGMQPKLSDAEAIAVMIDAAETVDALYALFEQFEQEWTDDLTTIASAKKAELQGQVA